MKTDRFDDECRRKLLGSPAGADPGEIERILGYVYANKPGLSGAGWSKRLLYGGSGLFLLGSLVYNVIQHYRNTHLQTSLASLTHRWDKRPVSAERIRHDTIYIIRPDPKEVTGTTSLPVSDAAAVATKAMEPANADQPNGRERTASTGSTSLAPPGNAIQPEPPYAGSRRSTLKPGMPASADGLPPAPQPPEPLRPAATSALASLPNGTPAHLTPKNEGVLNGVEATLSATRSRTGPGHTDVLNKGRLAPVGADLRFRTSPQRPGLAKHPNGRRAMTYPGNPTQRTGASPALAGSSQVNPEPTYPPESASDVTRPTLLIEPVVSRPSRNTIHRLTVILPSRSLVAAQPVMENGARPQTGSPALPSGSTLRAHFRLGGGLTGGSNHQAGGSVLGEFLLNRHWSIQAGLRLLAIEGFTYSSEQDFNEHQHEDFRQLYASKASQSADIQAIKQRNLLIQLPLQVAYHYPLGRQWGLRLGLGTDLDVWVHSQVSYDYHDSSRSAEHGQSAGKEPVYMINNLTVSPALERPWKKWLFRGGAFISPQLRPVGYKPAYPSWGGTLQVLYRLGN